ncbi:arsenic resistance protein [Salisediminibacterium halotolerans]|uniref:Arsenite efflux pump ArsB, ACR3 family n=1 Tax=Salisediminibacterium halotolerans TaxID=517425 RepID=A0A1H9PC36_9BACI|nr:MULTISPECIES: bile acid:sodium symporter [Salisediminibacterium]RLJ78036.1 ACR3 family arsenite efflux pump ArsB [Actinophytocola xinjiangensis]RPE88626.1 ACR3 family arsenite efflux pump ArsB [Salisediminibacterium halotolerans]TWG37013.1 ACR3 family arsenite efflux pump ArsB [Salisediminibacterium halotolerans]SER45824.1 Arsenite efflux pump ArsB, ACR3 family [Salisediminibacterium haloalkalitolerans]GEL08278.1 arsenite transporter [Salisediminibacterium halotolerans]
MMKVYHFPQKYLIFVVPAVLIFSFIVGLNTDTSALSNTILAATIVMIYATMVGLRVDELTKLKSESKLIGVSFLVNFIWIPLVAMLFGLTLLSDHPQLFAGLALVSLLPTSGMTIAWTGIQKGNIPAAVKLTVFGLIIGSVLTPWYLLIMVGQYVPVDIWNTFQTIFIVVFIPLILAQITTRVLLKRYSREYFQKKIKPNLSPLSVWGLLYVVFVSTSARSEMILQNGELIVVAAVSIVLFYIINYTFATFIARKVFSRNDGIALVNGTVLRNLSIAIGIAATSFQGEAALLVTLAFMVQYQSITYYAKFAGKRWFKPAEADERMQAKSV